MRLAEEELVAPESISDTLKCPVCFELLWDPVFACGRSCQHVFCRACVEPALAVSQNCPNCRADMDVEDLESHHAIRTLLGEVLVRCRWSCGWTGRFDERFAHSSKCPVAQLEALSKDIEKFSNAKWEISEREDRIKELEARVAEQDEQVVDISRQLVAREVRIAELEARISSQNLLIAEQDAELAALGCDWVVSRPTTGQAPSQERSPRSRSELLLREFNRAPPRAESRSPSPGMYSRSASPSRSSSPAANVHIRRCRTSHDALLGQSGAQQSDIWM